MSRRKVGTSRKPKPETKVSLKDVVVPPGLHEQVRKNLAKVVHPDINPTATNGEMRKINERLEKIQKIQQKSTHIQFVVDSSGSMTHWRDKLVTSYNKLLERQARFPGQSTFGFKSFHKEILPEPLTTPCYLDEIRTSGGTPLFDTIGRTIKKIDQQLDNPTDVVVIILTDGHDTGPDKTISPEEPHYPVAELRELVQEKLELGWQFIYCSEGYSVSHDAERIGIPAYATTGFDDYGKLMGKISKLLLSYRQDDIKMLTFKSIAIVSS